MSELLPCLVLSAILVKDKDRFHYGNGGDRAACHAPGVLNFGWRALLLTEFVWDLCGDRICYERLMHKKVIIRDFSARGW